MEVSPIGTTKPFRATLSAGKLKHDAQIQPVDIYKPVFRMRDGRTEKDFRDSFKYNIAAYKIDRMLGINMTPVSIERVIDGKPSAVTWWVDDVIMTEFERRAKKIQAPDFNRWTNQYHTMRMFDQLIANTDRNQGNLLITKDWKLWMIDHTRAFRTSHELLDTQYLARIDAEVLAKLRQLSAARVTRELGHYLTPQQIDALMARRDKLVEFFTGQISAKGKDAVLFNMPRSTPQVSLP